MSSARVHILITLDTLYIDLDGETPAEAFRKAMIAEVERITGEPDGAPPASEVILATLVSVYTDDEFDEEPSVTFTYAMLDEMSRLVGIFASNEDEPPEGLLRAYLFIANEYMMLRHYLFAREYYLKALEVLPDCHKEFLEEEDTEEQLEEACLNLLKIYGKRNERETADRTVALIRDLMPERYEAIQKRAARKLHLDYDPVEYTDEYLAILPELETKIEAEIDDPIRGHGFCFQYWSMKEKILKRDYGIEWDSPSALNPGVMFD